MAKKALHIVEAAYRATLEEQDDPVIWLAHAMRMAGAPLDVLLRGNAVNYAVGAQDASGLAFGDRTQTQPPQLTRDLRALMEEQVAVMFVREDAAERGILESELIEGVRPISRAELPELFARYDQVWYW